MKGGCEAGASVAAGVGLDRVGVGSCWRPAEWVLQSLICHQLLASLMPINSSAASARVTASDSQLFKMQPWEERHMLKRMLRIVRN